MRNGRNVMVWFKPGKQMIMMIFQSVTQAYSEKELESAPVSGHRLHAKLSSLLFSRPMSPGPPPHWLSGNTAVFRSNVTERHVRLLELHKKYGKVVRIQMGRPPLYGRDIFSIADPALCEEVLKSKSYAISKLTQARFQMLLGKYGLNGLDGETWKKHRRLILPLFHSGFLSYALEVISDKTQIVIEEWAKVPIESSVEVFSFVKNLGLDIISKAAFGYDLKVQEKPDDRLVKVGLASKKITNK